VKEQVGELGRRHNLMAKLHRYGVLSLKAERSGKDSSLPFYRKGVKQEKIKDHRVI